ncbi:hypothetical protein J6590_008346 [Homalodisca vitripennis]|nr:hypothetical protein J6590_008346 [Homalodisca vitripennis]
MNRRYSCLESVAVWIRNPSNRAFIICDLIIGLVLTIFTLILALFCVVGLNHFIKEAYSQGIEILWSEGFINIFVVMLLIGYIATIYSLAKDHIRPWYHWWTHCNNCFAAIVLPSLTWCVIRLWDEYPIFCFLSKARRLKIDWFVEDPHYLKDS